MWRTLMALAAAATIGASVIGGLFSAFGASQQNKAAKKAAQRQMDFQRNMYENRYAMTMADMKRSGLNPILAYQQGVGGTPGGSSYSPVNVGAGAGAAIQGGITSAIAVRRQKQELANMQAQQDLVKAQREKVEQMNRIDRPDENRARELDRLYKFGKKKVERYDLPSRFAKKLPITKRDPKTKYRRGGFGAHKQIKRRK